MEARLQAQSRVSPFFLLKSSNFEDLLMLPNDFRHLHPTFDRLKDETTF
jgi:hypothetical protein